MQGHGVRIFLHGAVQQEGPLRLQSELRGGERPPGPGGHRVPGGFADPSVPAGRRGEEGLPDVQLCDAPTGRRACLHPLRAALRAGGGAAAAPGRGAVVSAGGQERQHRGHGLRRFRENDSTVRRGVGGQAPKRAVQRHREDHGGIRLRRKALPQEVLRGHAQRPVPDAGRQYGADHRRDLAVGGHLPAAEQAPHGRDQIPGGHRRRESGQSFPHEQHLQFPGAHHQKRAGGRQAAGKAGAGGGRAVAGEDRAYDLPRHGGLLGAGHGIPEAGPERGSGQLLRLRGERRVAHRAGGSVHAAGLPAGLCGPGGSSGQGVPVRDPGPGREPDPQTGDGRGDQEMSAPAGP